MTGRSVPEWIGKTPDSKIPARVRLRVFERFNGICQETGRKIQAGDEWDCDHERALTNGGENRESNLRPVLREAHRKKTARDSAQKKKDTRVRKKQLGLHETRWPMQGGKKSKWKKKLDGTVVPRY
jgi:5-methylcytosine-specific restriction enzyme A